MLSCSGRPGFGYDLAMSPASELLHRLARLNVDRSNGQRKPHKPLLMLCAIQRWVVRGQREFAYVDVERQLRPLLDLYAPPVKGMPQPSLPYWHLQYDGVWELPDAASMERTVKDFPTVAALRKSVGRIAEPYATALAADPLLAEQSVQLLLDEHFEPSLHTPLRRRIGLQGLFSVSGLNSTYDLVREIASPELQMEVVRRRKREAGFREAVLMAYGDHCAVTGFHARLEDVPICLEAAHVRWHSHGGPSTVDNGLALTPTLHALFDHGAWTLDDERRVLVSRRFSGSDNAIAELRGLHGRPLRAPVPGCPPLSIEAIRWHREPNRGGVFRAPGLG